MAAALPSASEPPKGSEGFVNHDFPVAGLKRIQRHITGYDAEGKSVFLSTDSGDHHRVMGEKQAIANILYSTRENPVEIKDNADIELAKGQEPPIHYPGGSVVRMVDYAPGVESPLHRAMSLDYGVVLEGVFELQLDSGETKIMREGDVSIQRATSHKWKNLTGNGTLPGRMMYVLLDVKELYHNGNKVEGYMGSLAKDYIDH